MGLGGLISSAFGNKAAKKAAQAMTKGYKLARNEYNQGYNDIESMYEPYLTPAQNMYQNYVNTINGDTASFQASPWGKAFNDYVMNNTINQLQGTAAARGNMLSGNTLQELQTNIQSILTNDYLSRLGQYLGYAGGLGNTGLNITSAMGGYRDALANNLANSYMQSAQNNAAQQVAKYNNLGNLWGGLTDAGTTALSGWLGGASGLGGFTGATTGLATGGNSLMPQYYK